MSTAQTRRQMHDSGGSFDQIDPGASGTITVDRWGTIALTSAAAETRTLAAPTRQGARVVITMKVDAGDITMTVTGGYNEDGDTSYVFSDPGQFVIFESIESAVGTFVWRKTTDYGIGNILPADAAVLDELSALTATVTELNSAVGDGDEVVITTRPIVAADNGKTLYLSLAGGFTVTLPAPALGFRIRLIVKTAPTTSYVITTTGGSNLIYGHFVERAGGVGVAGAAQDTQNFVANQAIIGDWAEYYSDGTNWYVHGMVNVSAGVTFAVT